MKKFLLPHGIPEFKANLHCHTNISDGHYSPEEIKKIYMDAGYSIVAFTDHEILIPHPELADDDFLPLNGYEYEIISPKNPDNPVHKLRKTCHMCLIALEPDNHYHVCWHNNLWGNAMSYRDQAKIKADEPVHKREYSGDGITHVMQAARKAGFFVTYNHPAWSMEDMADIINYHGMHAIEIFNTGSVVAGWDDYVPYIYDSMLRRGKPIYCVAADDNHNSRGGFTDSFGGFTMIRAEKLEYRTVTKAMENGAFYASTGPLIQDLWFEDDMIHVTCSPAATIKACYGARRSKIARANNEPLTYAAFPVAKDDIYVRINILDPHGRTADTNAYYVSNLYSE